MSKTKYVATPRTLIRALLSSFSSEDAARKTQPKLPTLVPPTMRSSVEDVSPFTLREGLFFEAH